MRRLALLPMLAAGCLALSAGPASAALTAPETVYLDTHDTANDGDAGPVATSDVLAAGRQYVADVSGTFSAINGDVWAFHATNCGTTEPQPMTPSPGTAETQVGQDAETRFGLPWRFHCPALPQHGGGFQMDTGSGFGHPTAIGGPYSAPTAGHRYSYPLVGQDQPARFRVVDRPTADDNGVFTITVRPADADPGAPATTGGDAAATVAGETPGDTSAPTLTLPSSKSCLRTRRISLRLKAHKGDAITAATVRLNGRTVRKVRRRRGHGQRLLAMHLKVSGRRTGRASVLVVARTRHGKVVVARKTYRLCRS